MGAGRDEKSSSRKCQPQQQARGNSPRWSQRVGAHPLFVQRPHTRPQMCENSKIVGGAFKTRKAHSSIAESGSLIES